MLDSSRKEKLASKKMQSIENTSKRPTMTEHKKISATGKQRAVLACRP
jgi:hypothetical protein